jgi:cation transport ATPase
MILTLHERHLAKSDAMAVIKHLRETLGLKVRMITGDNKYSAHRVAKYVGIAPEDVLHNTYPEDKKRAVEKY